MTEYLKVLVEVPADIAEYTKARLNRLFDDVVRFGLLKDKSVLPFDVNAGVYELDMSRRDAFVYLVGRLGLVVKKFEGAQA